MIAKSFEDLTPQVTPQVKRLRNKIKGEISKSELMRILKLKDSKNFRDNYLLPALKETSD
jgi:hypothetical protein